MNTEFDLRALAEECLDSPGHFVVSATQSAGKGSKKIQITVDGDEGIDIETCSKISRKMATRIDELLPDLSYTLEVTSPGVDHPLQSLRQYRKNLGRKIRVFTQDKEYLGTLLLVSEESIRISQVTGKGKKGETVEVDIPMEGIRKAIVQVTF
jgi:ribosome maturation factor RimP